MWVKALFSLFYPCTCPMCGRYTGGKNGALCESCLNTLPRTEQALNRLNITEMTLLRTDSLLVKEMGQHMLREKNHLHLDKAAAFLFYEKDHPIQHVIHKMKYREQPLIGYYLGRQAALEMQYTDFFDEIDLIIPMPLHPKRMRERGYNQSEYIARGISEIIGKPVDTTHVMRVRNTPQQALQTEEARRHNMDNAFAVLNPEQLYKKHILLVDDIITTGETMKACLTAMRQCRGATSTVFALCKA